MEDTKKLATLKQEQPTKHYNNFLYKAIIVSVFLLILPILPSQAPELVNQNRTWELLQLLFVGIAVSYGLFSQKNKNKEVEKEHGSKFDNTNMYLSRLLQVSSVFDEETDFSSGSDEKNSVQTWNSQYHREEPVLVVEPKSSVHEEKSRVYAEKPLLLPIRSLKKMVSEPNITLETSDINGNFTRSNSSGSKRFSRDSRSFGKEEVGEFSNIKMGENYEENVVLRSPIPWRSRSGRMEVKEEIESIPLFSLDTEAEHSVSQPIESPSFKAQKTFPPKPMSKNKFPEFETKNTENLSRKNTCYETKMPPPAPPPPPPPPSYYYRKPPLGKSGFVPKKETGRTEIEEVEKLGGESDEETEDEGLREENEKEEEENISNGGSDVNKKADEFIAKFREQIRLQRIESIRKIGRNYSR